MRIERPDTESWMKSGFTLVEALLSALILGAAIVVLLAGASRCLAVMKAAKNYQTAVWVAGLGEAEHPFVATNDLEFLKVDRETLENGFSYERTVEEDEDEDGLYVVRTRVTWPGRGGRIMQEETARYVWVEKKE